MRLRFSIGARPNRSRTFGSSCGGEVTQLTKARLTYLAVLACLVLAFLMAGLSVLPLSMSDGNL